MGEILLKKIIDKDFGELTIDEVKVIINQDSIFSINKKDKKVLEKFIEENSFEINKDKVSSILKDGLPNSFAILSALDKHSIAEDGIKIDFRKDLMENLKQMNHQQLGIFIDKVLMISDESKI